MNQNDFKMYNYISNNFAERNDASSELKPLYKIAIWLPAIVVAIYGIVSGIIILCLNIETYIKIISLVGLLVGTLITIALIAISQSITRLVIYHAERTNYNTSKIQFQLNQIVSILEKDKENTKSISSSSNNKNDLETQYMLTISSLDLFITNKIIDDEKFNIYINSLEQLGDYKKTKEFILHYKNEYNKLKKTSDVPDKTFDALNYKIINLLNQNKISKEKYDEYVSLLKKITLIEDETEKEQSYKKLEIILSMY